MRRTPPATTAAKNRAMQNPMKLERLWWSGSVSAAAACSSGVGVADELLAGLGWTPVYIHGCQPKGRDGTKGRGRKGAVWGATGSLGRWIGSIRITLGGTYGLGAT